MTIRLMKATIRNYSVKLFADWSMDFETLELFYKKLQYCL